MRALPLLLPQWDLPLLFPTVWQPAILAPALALALCLLLRDLPLLLRNLPHLLVNLPLPPRDLPLLLENLPLSLLLLLLLWDLPLPRPQPLRYLPHPQLARCQLQKVCQRHGSLLSFFQYSKLRSHSQAECLYPAHF